MTRRLALILTAAAATAAAGAPALAASSHPATPAAQAIPSATASVSPQPGAGYAEAQTEISFRGVPASSVTRVSAVGSSSGQHSGRILPDSDGQGASFVPDKPFTKGEKVSVTAPLHVYNASNGHFTFTVGLGAPLPTAPIPTPGYKPRTQTFHSEPTLHPAVTTSTRAADATPGLTFTAPYGLKGLGGNEISDNNGNVVYYAPTNDVTTDFRVQTYQGKPVLTWWEGKVLLPGFGRGSFVIADISYHVIKRFSAGNDLSGDLHEFVLTPQGTALITSYAPERVSTAAGSIQVLDSVIQSYDVTTGRVLFEWHALDHIPLTSSYLPRPSNGSLWDAFHVNSVQPYGGNRLLVSLRSDHQVLAISMSTGAVSFTIGGMHSTVGDPSDLTTHSQHDAEPHADGTITVFDNGAGAGAGQHKASRGLVLKITSAGIHSVVTLPAPDGQLAVSQGNVQLLAGAYLVNFGSTGTYATYDAKGAVVSDVHLQQFVQTYRAFKASWHATPTTQPKIAVTRTASGSTTYVSWNGATEVGAWRVLAGPDTAHLSATASAVKSGFETTITVPATGGVEQVQALDARGNVIGTSAASTIG